MAGALDEDGKVRFPGWPAGINNVKHEDELAPEELRDSVNYAFDGQGIPERRISPTQRIAGTNCHSLWGNGVQAVYMDDGALLLIDADTWTTTQLATGYTNKWFSFAQIGHRLFFSNGEVAGRVNLIDKTVLPGLGTPTPALNVTAQASGFGGLPAGRYLIGMVYEDAAGEESGCPGVTSAQVQDGGAISISLEGTVPAIVDKIRVYVSEPNGRRDELYSYDRYAVDTTSLVINNTFTGRPLETMYLEAMPPCRYLTAYNGRLYGAIGSEVICSAVQRYGLYDADGDSLGLYPQEVTVLEHFNGGVFVVADRTYAYIGSGPGEMVLRDDVFGHPGVHHSGRQVPANLFPLEGLPSGDLPYWFTSRGAVLGLPGGEVRPLMKGKAEPARFAKGATGVVEINGASQVITAVQGRTGPVDTFAIQDKFAVRVVKNGLSDPVEP